MMKKEDSFHTLNLFFKAKRVARITDLFTLLGTNSRMSIFRKLSELNYLSSYTHAGAYYTLHHIPNFDSTGLWYFNEIGFSKKGNLKETLLNLIEKSESGMTHEELEKRLHIRVQNTLLDLINSNKINRTKISNCYLYTSVNEVQSKRQIQNREAHMQGYKEMSFPDWIIIEILAAIIRVKSITIDSQKIVSELKLRKNLITIEQVEKVISQLNLKKTLDSK
jgi:hypothetical protein